MSTNINFKFDTILAFSRTNALIVVEQGTMYVTVTGAADAVEAYIKSASINIDILDFVPNYLLIPKRSKH